LRFGLAPLYNTHREVHTGVQRIKSIVESGLPHDFEGRVATVT
jgi:kynureninase